MGEHQLERSDPFRITGPAVISFSGGRTSAYMLWRVLQAHGGALPDDVVCAFANTGREMPATLDFVRDCAAVWNVNVHWLEYGRGPSGPVVIQVSHNSASRNGEPFAALLGSKSMLPNPVARFCTIELKIRTQARFLRAEYGWDHWTSLVGLRADEPSRVARALARGSLTKDRWHNVCPLAACGITQSEVFRFWKAQPFDLRLAGPWEGNCDGCFLKNRAAIERMLLDHPDRMQWWSDMEALPHGVGAGGTFRADREPYSALAATVRDQGRLPWDGPEADVPCDAMCGA